MDINQEERKLLEFWKKNKTFEKSLSKTKKGKPYIFYDGPPFATGLPHYGHILASTIKDAVPRFWTMKGRFVKRVWGWDCHGLPIENIAEKELGIKTKDEIEKMGIDKFNKFCRSKVLTYAGEWGKTVERIARWVDFENSYKTMDNNYIESVWWAFKELYKKGFIYKGEKVLMYCTRCGTPIASSEIAMDQSYKTVKEDTITVKFKLKDKDAYFLAWTTTPWTLPSNLALTVNLNMKYVYLKDLSDGTVYVFAKEAISRYFKDSNNYKIIKEVSGEDLVGTKYEPLFPYFENLKNSFRVIPGDFVNSEDGTGIVHTAPAFGEDDYNACKENGIDFIQPVDKQGKFTKEVKDFAGMYIKDADAKIIEFLKKQGKVVKVEKKAHEYPFCYRCETPLMYRAIPSWFVNIQKIKKRMLKLNEKMNWYPENLKHGRFQKNVENAPDWTISRNRYWASAIPIWECKECEKIKVIGSIEELKKNALNLPKKEIDLHKDFLDNVKMKCECGGEMKRIPEVLDCWFESGAMPFAQFHYPFENKKYFEENFPAEFVAEYIAQTRAWFYYCLVMSSILFDDIPFKNVVTTGTILAENGDKMSKSKGNFPDPWKLFEKFGVDSLRFYLLSSVVMNAESINFSEKTVDEIYKKVLMLLYNVNNFYSLDKKIKIEKPKSKNIMDKWILSKLNELIKNTTEYFEKYDTVSVCSEIRKFVDDLSTWYVRRSRDRFNEGDKEAEKTLGWTLQECSKVIAPVMPFVSEFIYHNVADEKDSVHLQDWPDYDKKAINEKINSNMAMTRNIISLALKERDIAKLSLKQPLAKLTIYYNGTIDKEYIELIREEANVKAVGFQKNKEKNITVFLDTKLTLELEAEGYAREMSRAIQDFRKKLGLNKKEKVEVEIICGENFKKILEQNKKLIEDRTNSRKLEFVTTGKERFKNKTEFTIKDKRGIIGILAENITDK